MIVGKSLETDISKGPLASVVSVHVCKALSHSCDTAALWEIALHHLLFIPDFDYEFLRDLKESMSLSQLSRKQMMEVCENLQAPEAVYR